MMNEFLENYEILGGKMRPVLAGDTPLEKLDTIRKALGEVKIRDDEDNRSDEDMLMPVDIDEEKERWDCETILCMSRASLNWGHCLNEATTSSYVQ